MKIYRIFASIFLSTIMVTGAFAQSAVQSLNDGWSFSEDQVHWKAVALPHTWNKDAYYTQHYKQGIFYYKRTLALPVGAQSSFSKNKPTNKRFFLKLEAASKTSTIYINGQLVGTHRGGYTASVFDLTPYLHSAKTANEILITVNNADEHVAPISADFTFMGGIYRQVKLITTQQQHFSMTEDGADGVFVSATNVSEQKADVTVKCRLRNDDVKSKDCYVVHTIYAPDGKLVGHVQKRVRLNGNQTVSLLASLPQVKTPVLWSPEHPNLYRVKTELLDASLKKEKAKSGKKMLLDRQEHYVGLRWCAFDAEKGFFLNGKPYKLNGMCRHQDQRPYGVALEDDMHRKDLHMLKEMGCNFIRLAHYPQAEAVLEMCDRIGMLVWEEVPVVNYVPDDEAFAENAEQQLREMIRQHYNHSSIILWGYMNEILLRVRSVYSKQEDYEKAVDRILALAGKLEKIVHEEDATRHSTMALHGSDEYNKYHIADFSQVLGWNLYQGWYGGKLTDFENYLANQHKNHPTHPVIISEWGAGSDLRLHSPRHRQAFDFSCEYQQDYIEHYLPVISQTPYILGGTYWNFVDFSSASRGEATPHINNKGVVTADRTIKDVYYYFQSAWRKDIPVVHIATRDWKKREMVESCQQVKVYTNAPEVTLKVNGKPVGTKTVANNVALFDVQWQKGINRLEAQTAQAIDQATVQFKSIPKDAKKIEDIAINVGSHCYYQSAKSGITWASDQAYEPGSWGYMGGSPVSTQTEIQLTEDGALYQTMREDIEAYRFDVPQGRYELELLFTDLHQKQAQSAYLLGRDKKQGETQSTQGGFAVEANGTLLESRFQPGIENGYFQAIRRSYIINQESMNGLKIEFKSLGGKTFLSGIRLRKL